MFPFSFILMYKFYSNSLERAHSLSSYTHTRRKKAYKINNVHTLLFNKTKKKTRNKIQYTRNETYGENICGNVKQYRTFILIVTY